MEKRCLVHLPLCHTLYFKFAIAVGLNHGFITTRREPRARPSQRKGKENKKVKLIREIVREVTGWSPYEKRIMEILKGGGNNPTKRAQKFAKRRLGTHTRAKRKVEDLGKVIAEVKKREAAAKAEQKAKEKGKEKKTKEPGAKKAKTGAAAKKGAKASAAKGKAAAKPAQKGKEAAKAPKEKAEKPEKAEKGAAAPKAEKGAAAPKAEKAAPKAAADKGAAKPAKGAKGKKGDE